MDLKVLMSVLDTDKCDVHYTNGCHHVKNQNLKFKFECYDFKICNFKICNMKWENEWIW